VGTASSYWRSQNLAPENRGEALGSSVGRTYGASRKHQLVAREGGY
jgi:hypothetical protein